MLALKLLKTFKSSPRAEDSLEMKCLEHSEGLKFVGKGGYVSQRIKGTEGKFEHHGKKEGGGGARRWELVGIW